jgi:hypothetical protein
VTEFLVSFAATAKKELKDLPSDAIGRLLPRIRELAEIRARPAAKSCMATETAGGFEWETTASFMQLTTDKEE